MGRRRQPTIGGAVRKVRRDPDARFASLLAAVFAFSLGFAFGFVIGSQEDDAAVADPGVG